MAGKGGSSFGIPMSAGLLFPPAGQSTWEGREPRVVQTRMADCPSLRRSSSELECHPPSMPQDWLQLADTNSSSGQ